jgi:hypothetical protein
MDKKSLGVALLAMLVVGVGRPANADPKFLEPYGDIFSARPVLTSPNDGRPKDALQQQGTKKKDATEKFLVSPFYQWLQPLAHFHFSQAGLGLLYASDRMSGHPWQFNVNLYNFNSNYPFTDLNTFGQDYNFKYVVWQGKKSSLPVVSVIGRYQHLENNSFTLAGNRFDGIVALDQKVARGVYFTAEGGYAHLDPYNKGVSAGAKEVSAVATGLGLTWSPMRKLSVSVDYRPTNVVDTNEGLYGTDFWTASVGYTVDRFSSVRVGAGKHHTWMANYIANLSW